MNQQTENQVTGFLGLCFKAGRVVSGQEACVDLVRGGECVLALLDGGASENTRKRLMDACHSHNVPLYELSGGALGHAIGKRGRMVAAFRMDGMSQKLLSLLENEPRL